VLNNTIFAFILQIKYYIDYLEELHIMANKTIGIMQPYFFPYIGYWQLMNAVDEYVVYDDVNFIKGGWINRNRILSEGKPLYINVQLSKASPNKKINEIEIFDDPRLCKKLFMSLERCYKKAPYYNDVSPLLESIFAKMNGNLAQFLFASISDVCKYLDITTKLVLSSELDKDTSLAAEAKVIDICKCLSADTYYNAIGGQELYSREHFASNGLELKFVKTGDIVYPQYDNDFVPGLSIIDVMMFNSKDRIKELLNQFELL